MFYFHKIIFTGLLFLFFVNASAQEQERKIKVRQIDSTESYYFIKGVFKTKPKNKFVIVSKKEMISTSCDKIKPKKTYIVTLSNYLDNVLQGDLPPVMPGKLQFREEGYIIWDGFSDLPYKSSDIKSLCYDPRRTNSRRTNS